MGPRQREYIAWLLNACSDDDVKVDALMDADAIDLLAERLRTPLQIEMHLTLAFEHAFRLGAKPVSVEVVQDILSRAIDDREPTFTRNGYDAATLADQFNAKPGEMKAFLAGTLVPE